MGEEEKKDAKPKEEEDKKKIEEEVPEEVVLKVDMHCGACARKVARSLKGFQGVKEVMTECKASKVVVKGKELDAAKLSERIQKKTGRKVDIVSMLPKPPESKPEPEPEPEKKQQPGKTKEEKKDEPPPVITIVLKMSMHCDACAQRLQKRIRKIKGVESVKTELANEQVVVTGVLEPEKLMNDIIKKTRKQASIVVKEEEKKEEKKEAEKKEEEKEEAPNTKKADDINMETKKNESSPPKNYMDYYSYAPEMFSDENPHACLVM